MSSALRSAQELERKYDVGDDVVLPDLSGLPGVDRVVTDEHHLEATYYDTGDLRLRIAGITLRQRTGGTDDGWHLKLPSGRAREEVTVDGEQAEVPHELAALVRSRVRREHLVLAARLSTHRTTHRLVGADGRALVEVADDRVVGRVAATGAELVWREWEAELLDGEESLLDAVEPLLLEAGAVPASAASKLGRLLPTPPVTTVESGRRRPTLGDAVRAHLAEQVEELLARDPQTRRDLPDALHKMRVATRRLRSALVTFRPVLVRERTDPLRDELRWLAEVLGAARDAEVMHARLRRLVDGQPDDLVLGPVRDRIDTLMTRRHREAHDRVLEALDGERYLGLLDALVALAADPPLLPAADEDARRALPPLVRKTWRRLDRAMTAAQRAPRGPEQDRLLHEVRKDAKRSRYAAEAVVPVLGGPAGRYAAAVAALQESLGDFQDGVVTREVLRELGALGHVAGENGFTFGRLHALEQVRAENAVARFPAARAALSRKRLRRWLRR